MKEDEEEGSLGERDWERRWGSRNPSESKGKVEGEVEVEEGGGLSKKEIKWSSSDEALVRERFSGVVSGSSSSSSDSRLGDLATTCSRELLLLEESRRQGRSRRFELVCCSDKIISSSRPCHRSLKIS